MTKLMTTLTISAIASILIMGGFATATPNAFSTYGGYNDEDDDHDDCDNGNHYNHDDDCDNNMPKDPCDCEKPDTLKFKFSTPGDQTTSEFRIEIYKKLNDIGNPDKELTRIVDITNTGDYQIESSSFGKDKLNSNTVFAVYKIVENYDDELVSTMEVHTSCSQSLYKGLTIMDSGYSIEITDGLKDGETSISESDPLTCGDEPEPVKMGNIIVKKTITNDNGGDAEASDFTITLTNVDANDEFILVHDQEDPTLNVNEVPVGTYKLSETKSDDVTTAYTTVLISGDTNCPSTLDESFKIKKGKTLSCTIYNDDDFVAGGNEGNAPTVKITVQVNNLEGVTSDQFEYVIGTETMKKNGNIITIPINTPTMFNQTNFIDNSDPTNPAVLPSSIEGDGNCPEVLGSGGSEIGLLTLSANQNIECIIVYGKAIEPGVVFHFDSLRFDTDTVFDSNPSQDPLQPDLDKCDSLESTLPCIVFNEDTSRFNVIPNIPTGQLRVTTLVQLNIIALAADNTIPDPMGTAGCTFEGITTSPNTQPAFAFQCQDLTSEEFQFRVNYALIETLQDGKTLT